MRALTAAAAASSGRAAAAKAPARPGDAQRLVKDTMIGLQVAKGPRGAHSASGRRSAAGPCLRLPPRHSAAYLLLQQLAPRV